MEIRKVIALNNIDFHSLVEEINEIVDEYRFNQNFYIKEIKILTGDEDINNGLSDFYAYIIIADL